MTSTRGHTKPGMPPSVSQSGISKTTATTTAPVCLANNGTLLQLDASKAATKRRGAKRKTESLAKIEAQKWPDRRWRRRRAAHMAPGDGRDQKRSLAASVAALWLSSLLTTILVCPSKCQSPESSLYMDGRGGAGLERRIGADLLLSTAAAAAVHHQAGGRRARTAVAAAHAERQLPGSLHAGPNGAPIKRDKQFIQLAQTNPSPFVLNGHQHGRPSRHQQSASPGE
jgi:hypothetical protein